MLQEIPFDLVLMDCHMPVLDGLAAASRICAGETPKVLHIPIIALTASIIPETQEKFLATGMTDFPSKPLNKKTLAAMLERYIPGYSPQVA